jgi:hypothetical protein
MLELVNHYLSLYFPRLILAFVFLVFLVPSLAANVAENSILFAAYGLCQNIVAQWIGVPKVEDLSTGWML